MEYQIKNRLLRVLIVEDSENDALLMVRQLRQQYHILFERVETAAAMDGALKRGTWDIVISDYVLPYFGAAQALRLLKQDGYGVPFILVSGKISEEIMLDDARDYVSKDDLSRLTIVVAHELERGVMENERRKGLEPTIE